MLFLSASPCRSQLTQIKNTLGLSLIAELDTNFYGPESYNFYYDSVKITVLNQKTRRVIQSFPWIELPAAPPMLEHAVFIVEDLNFDGYSDFRVITGYYVNGAQTDYDCYLWNPTAVKFLKDTVISGAMGLYVNKEKKIIHSHWRYGFESMGHCVYQWQQDRFVLVAYENGDFDGTWLETWKLINGVKTPSSSSNSDWGPHDECNLW
jgi:hypothetical protein